MSSNCSPHAGHTPSLSMKFRATSTLRSSALSSLPSDAGATLTRSPTSSSPVKSRARPQEWHVAASGVTDAPQAGEGSAFERVRTPPHLRQNRAPTRFSWPQKVEKRRWICGSSILRWRRRGKQRSILRSPASSGCGRPLALTARLSLSSGHLDA